MSYNGSGTFLINSAGQPVVANTVISATVFNALTSDLATGLSTAITKDGQTTITNNIPFGSNKITGLGSGTAAADAANLGQVQSTVAKLITVTGTDTITGSMSPQLTAYAAGQLFYFVANAANTSAVTLNIDSLGAKSITRDGSSALAAGDINSGEVVVVIYDGTRFQMINAANSFGNTTINGTLTVTGNAGFQANVSITSALSVGGVFAVTGAATFTANPTLSGGTANGVLYLNGSKVATSGSALVFDGTNFGLGTASPANYANYRNLAISGTTGANIDMLSGSTKVGNLFNDGTNFYAYNVIAGALVFGTNNTERMRLDSSGNLGIGTTSPARQLSISNASQSNIQLTTTGAGGTITDGFQLQFDGSSNYVWGYENVPTLFGTNNAERARITAGGALAVGLTTPTFPDGNGIHLNNSSGAARFHVTNNTTGTTATDGSEFTVAGSDLYIINNESATMQFWTNGTERARITSGGDFCVGKTGTDPTIGLGMYTAPNGVLSLVRQGSTNGTQTLLVYSLDAAAYRFYVGMDGTISATNTTISAISDQRYKENIRDLDVGLNAILALKPRKFDWKAGKGKDIKNDRGWIAQEFEQVFPDMISEWKDPAPEGEEPYKAVRADLIPVLVKAMQEQQAMINELKAKVAALEA